MKLSLSGRLIEVEYRHCEMDVPDFMRLAKECGYDAVEFRATQIPAETTEEEAKMRRRASGCGTTTGCWREIIRTWMISWRRCCE